MKAMIAPGDLVTIRSKHLQAISRAPALGASDIYHETYVEIDIPCVVVAHCTLSYGFKDNYCVSPTMIGWSFDSLLNLIDTVDEP